MFSKSDMFIIKWLALTAFMGDSCFSVDVLTTEGKKIVKIFDPIN